MDNSVPGPSRGYQKKPVKSEKDTQQRLKTRPEPGQGGMPDYSSLTAKKWPLLVEALDGGNTAAVKKLIEEGINVNVVRNGVTPLMLAASKGSVEIAEAILQAGVNVNEGTDEGWTALHKAASDQAETGIIDLLLQSGINVNAKNKQGKTALDLAEEQGHRDIARVIKRHVQQLRVDGQDWEDFLRSPEGKPYRLSRRSDSLSLLFRLWWLLPPTLGALGTITGFLSGAVVPAAGTGILLGLLAGLSVFFYAKRIRAYLDDRGPLSYLDIQMVRAKRKAGEAITVERRPREKAAEEAAEKQLPDATFPEQAAVVAAEESADDRAPRRVQRETPNWVVAAIVLLVLSGLIGAGVMNRVALTRWYYTKKLDHLGVPYSEQAFLEAVSRGHGEAVDLFLRAGINSNAADEHGRTALMIACEKGHEELAATLIELNAGSLQQADASGNTAMMTASAAGRETIVRSLVEHGADVNYTVPSREGAASALQAVVDAPELKEEHLRIVRTLLQHGADAKGQNAVGRSPLLFAADHGYTEAARALIDHGADVNAADLMGIFPLQSAACRGHAGFVALLAERGANMNVVLPDGQTPLMCAVRAGHRDTAGALLKAGAHVNAKTAGGATALTDAVGAGNVDMVQFLLQQGADPAGGTAPEPFLALRGATVAIAVRKNKVRDVLGRIANAASRDGYRVHIDPNPEQRISLKTKGPWNKVLHDLAAKQHLVLIVKDKEVFVIPYDPAAVKQEAM